MKILWFVLVTNTVNIGSVISGLSKEGHWYLSIVHTFCASRGMQSRGKILLPLEALSELDVFEIKPDGQEVLEKYV